jgi:hypothetical protein
VQELATVTTAPPGPGSNSGVFDRIAQRMRR